MCVLRPDVLGALAQHKLVQVERAADGGVGDPGRAQAQVVGAPGLVIEVQALVPPDREIVDPVRDAAIVGRGAGSELDQHLDAPVDAVVFDSPTILYYARNEAAGKVAVVGNLFDIQYYGFLFPQGSELREPVNRALLKMHETGLYHKIFNKWFGSY